VLRGGSDGGGGGGATSDMLSNSPLGLRFLSVLSSNTNAESELGERGVTGVLGGSSGGQESSQTSPPSSVLSDTVLSDTLLHVCFNDNCFARLEGFAGICGGISSYVGARGRSVGGGRSLGLASSLALFTSSSMYSSIVKVEKTEPVEGEGDGGRRGRLPASVCWEEERRRFCEDLGLCLIPGLRRDISVLRANLGALSTFLG